MNLLKNFMPNGKIDSKYILQIQKMIKDLPLEDKKQFIDLYCQETGFPDMEKTSELIVQNVTEALKEASKVSGVDVLLAGYNPTCSVANGHALPGSDFDTFFICLKNWNNFSCFRNEFIGKINPLLCSMTHNRTNDLPDFVLLSYTVPEHAVHI